MPVSILKFPRQHIVIKETISKSPPILHEPGLDCFLITNVHISGKSDPTIRGDSAFFNLLVIFGIEKGDWINQTFIITFHISSDFVGEDKLQLQAIFEKVDSFNMSFMVCLMLDPEQKR
jgi:hypothetical protein